jgi:CHAT domain-containing protein
MFTGNNFLCLDHIIGRIKHDDPTHGNATKRTVSMLMVSDPTGDLYGAQDEANYILGKLRGSKLIVTRYGSEIRKQQYLNLLKSETFEIIHYSGHSASSTIPGKSHHVFMDGLVYGDEIEALHGVKMPRLVFSNSCQSAESSLGNEDTGNTGLAGSYLKAGVGSCVAAIWPVSDIGSGQFASDFYRYLLFGSSMGEALLRSRRTAFKQWGFQNFIWGSYIFYGNPYGRL